MNDHYHEFSRTSPDSWESQVYIAVNSTNDRQQDAYDVLCRYGAYAFNSRSAQAVGYGSTGDTNAQQYATDTEGQQRIQLREKELLARKQAVQTGEVGIPKEVVTEQQTINVPTTRVEVVIERRPASGQLSDTPIGEGETYQIPAREEQVTVEKQPVVREEVRLGKRQVQETQQVSDTVKREEARIERQGDVNEQGSDVIDGDR
jgi:uncharacterized protein (TIGR02271 family)